MSWYRSAVCFIFLSFPSGLFAQSFDIYPSGNDMDYKDSVLVAGIVKGMNDTIAHTDTTDEGMIIGSSAITGGHFTYAPDRSFKVLTIEAEYCGAYCNPEYYTHIYYSIGGREYKQMVEWAGIYDIYEVSKPYSGKEYLLLAYSGERPRGTETIEYGIMYHVRIVNGTFHFIPFTIRDGKEFRNEGSLLVERSVFCHEDMESQYIRFDNKKNMISCLTYILHEYDLEEGQDMYCTKLKTFFRYEKGIYKQVN